MSKETREQVFRYLIYAVALCFVIFDISVNYKSTVDIIRMFAYGVVINLVSSG